MRSLSTILAAMPFVTFEGVEGSGKSSQMRFAAQRLRGLGRDVVETREPGGTAIGRTLREILMDADNSQLDPVTEWLLLEADRRQHVAEVLAPAIARGAFVLCDRYSDATEAYQQHGRGLDAEAVRAVDAIARDGIFPDLTLLYDLDARKGLARARARDEGRSGRFEAADLDFHERVREAYLAIARREPGRVKVIFSDAPRDEVSAATWRALSERFSL
ncbi:MAG TPA: dTMP kinase [Thermoanaerobaculia bacterium]|nr:dTMP kinase [Thermoanaerobaculia bacterium]